MTRWHSQQSILHVILNLMIFFTRHHVYRIWTHLDEEEFFCEREPGNKVNRNAIKKITKYEIVVGDFP